MTNALALDDKAYIRFVESRGLYIPNDDCADYREQEDYLAVQFMNHEAESLRQQITELQKKCRAADEVIDFYAKEENWVRSNKALFTRILCTDVDAAKNKTIREVYYRNLEVGGKRARNFQKDYPETEL